MLTQALFIAAALQGAPNTDPGARATPLPEAYYTRIDNDSVGVAIYRSDNATYTLEGSAGWQTTVTVYPLPCYPAGHTFLWREEVGDNPLAVQPYLYAVLTVQGEGETFTLQTVGPVNTQGVAKVDYQPATEDEAALGEEFCARRTTLSPIDGSRVTAFKRLNN